MVTARKAMILGYEDIRKDTVTGEWQMSITERDLITSHDANDYRTRKEKYEHIDYRDENDDKYLELAEISTTSYFSSLYKRWIREILHSPILDLNNSFDRYRADSLHNLIYKPDHISISTLRTPSHPWSKYTHNKLETVASRLTRLHSTMGDGKNNCSSSLIMMEAGLRLHAETSDHGDIDDLYDIDNEDSDIPLCSVDMYKKLCEVRGFDK